MGHVHVGHRWDRVAMDLLDMSVTTAKGNRYVLVMVDCFSRWTETCPLPDKTALAVADAFFQHIVYRFGMPMVIHSDQGREFENKAMQELCLLCGSHKTRTTPYHPESDGLVERFNRTLLMMLAMFAGENRDDWDDLLLAVMMAYRSSVHESTGFSPYRFMFGEECTLPMDVGLPRWEPDLPDPISSPYALWVRDAWKWHMIRSVDIRTRQYSIRKDSMIGEWSDGCSLWGIGSCIITPLQRSANLSLLGLVRILLCPWPGGLLGFSDIWMTMGELYIVRI